MTIYKSTLLLVIIITNTLIGCNSSVVTNETTIAPSSTQLSPTPLNSNTSDIDLTATIHVTTVTSSPIQSVPTRAPTVSPTDTALLLPSSSVTPLSTNLSDICTGGETGSVESAKGLRGVLGPIVPLDSNIQETASGVLVGGTPLRQHEFPTLSGFGSIGFSPDGNWLAYQKHLAQPGLSEPYVYLLSTDGQILKTAMPIKTADTPNYWFLKWMTNELMMIQYYSPPSGGPDASGTYVVDSYSIFNVFTGERRDDLLEALPHWGGWTTVYFSADATRAVYISSSQSLIGISIVLWDIEQKSLLWSKRFMSDLRADERYLGFRGFLQTAFWSPDSTKFVFTTAEQDSASGIMYTSYLVDRDGTEERALVKASSFEDAMISGGLWSPDGRFIYYFTLAGEAFLYDLAVYQKIELCSNFSTLVAWSPYSDYLAFVGEVDEEMHLLLLNIYTGAATSVSAIKDIGGLEWVANEDWLTLPKVEEP